MRVEMVADDGTLSTRVEVEHSGDIEMFDTVGRADALSTRKHIMLDLAEAAHTALSEALKCRVKEEL